jgi:RHS repeat-associated protein
VTLIEQPLYGSSRLGQRKVSLALNTLATADYQRVLQKQYELVDHLGNVRALVSDAKVVDVAGTYKPDLLAYYNYYPFGMLQPNRNGPATKSLAGGYRYGYNGKEMDNNGELGLTTYDYGFRIYNPGLGKFLSVDPLTKSYPMLTPYQFASNSPISGIDLDGKEFFWFMAEQTEMLVFGTTHIKGVHAGFEERAVNTILAPVMGLIESGKEEMRPERFMNATFDPGIAERNMRFEIRKAQLQMKGVIDAALYYVVLAKRVSKGEDKAIGEAGFEAALFFIPYGEGVPKGFKSEKQLMQFAETAQAGLTNAGAKEASELYLQGSSVTGRSFKTGLPFDVGRVSDLDLAIVSETLFKRAQELGLVKEGGGRTVPITLSTPAGRSAAKALGIEGTLQKLSEMMGRDVNTMLFETGKAVKEKGASRRLSGNPKRFRH